MTKKSKKKALKTGVKDGNGPRVTTYILSSNMFKKNTRNLPGQNENDDDDVPKKSFITRKQKKMLELKKQLEEKEIYKKENEKRQDYPLDLWYHLSRHIKPDQIPTFACICKTAYYMTKTKKFWINVYQRYVTDHTVLPAHLKPHAISTVIGMKARVIRSLYYGYQPFSTLINEHKGTMENLSNVEYKICESSWWKQIITKKRNLKLWIYNYKLKPRDLKAPNIFKHKDLMTYNSEENYCILKIFTTSFMNLSNPTGLCLSNINISVSRDMRFHKVKLVFHDYRRDHRYIDNQGVNIVIDPVVDVQVLQWWHPEYPHPLDH